MPGNRLFAAGSVLHRALETVDVPDDSHVYSTGGHGTKSFVQDDTTLGVSQLLNPLDYFNKIHNDLKYQRAKRVDIYSCETGNKFTADVAKTAGYWGTNADRKKIFCGPVNRLPVVELGKFAAVDPKGVGVCKCFDTDGNEVNRR